MNPITRKRLQRFRQMRRAWWSLWLLLALYAVSLVSELIAGDTPLYVRFNGRAYFPLLRFHPDDTFTGSGRFTRADYKRIAQSEGFRANPANRMLFPILPYGPLETVRPESIELPDEVQLSLWPEPAVGFLAVGPEGQIQQAEGMSYFAGGQSDAELIGQSWREIWEGGEALERALDTRWANRESAYMITGVQDRARRPAMVSLATFLPRARPPATLRLTFREPESAHARGEVITVDRQGQLIRARGAIWSSLPEPERERLAALARERFERPVPEEKVRVGDREIRARFYREEVSFPFRPTRQHPLGLDSAGRDVFARILYALRTALTFGFLLVLVTMVIGIVLGALQGYYGGWVDLLGQRAIEIWESLPFLYVLILMGSVFGRSFSLLLICYGIFNWVGISYYLRAEFLRLRKQAFVEAARGLGLSTRRIIFRHILPNGLVPVITFFPFSLVGAVGVLAALDYLGFGMPPPTPSWGELLSQAQEYSWAWWLALYPSLALFVVMLLGVFIGEGARAAFDPKQFSRLE